MFFGSDYFGLAVLLENLKGVGPKTNEELLKYNLLTGFDLLSILPKMYQDRRKIKKINVLFENEQALVKVKIKKINPVYKKKFLEVLVGDDTEELKLFWFNFYPFLIKQLNEYFLKNKELLIFGKVNLYNNYLSITHPEITVFKKEFIPELVPVYRNLANIKQANLKKIFLQVIELLKQNLNKNENWEFFFSKYNFESPLKSLLTIHNPPQNCKGKLPLPFETKARKNLAFNELLSWRLKILSANKKNKIIRKNIKEAHALLLDYYKLLPFKITPEQKKIIDEIIDDLSDNMLMTRLLQGEVGSGKTVVLGAALLFSLKSLNGQVALMAPTEILARQHYEFFKNVFKSLGYNTSLLVGNLSEKEKKASREQLTNGEIDFLIGSQALISHSTMFKNLTLAVIDEQHKFGVEQRLKLINTNTDLLTVSATPIPRTLALTLYGDLKISFLKNTLKKKLPKTKVFLKDEREEAFLNFAKIISEGGQGFLVNPTINEVQYLNLEDSKLSSLESLKKSFTSFYKQYKGHGEKLTRLNIAVLHGGLKKEEKIEIVEQFKNKKINVLLSTSIIEVGFDVPEANCILINGAEYFGLAQLHQLKGRVGRKGQEAFCFLLANSDLTENGCKRLGALVKDYTGEELAELDLKLRGPGEHLGLKQSGWPEFYFAKFPEDFNLINEANILALKLINDKSFMNLL